MSIGEPQRIQDVGYRLETNYGQSLITPSVAPIHFGTYRNSWGNFPVEIQEPVQFYNGSDYDPYITEISKTFTLGEILYTPVDSLLWRFALGGASGDGTTHTLTPITSGDLDPFTTRWESSNNTQLSRKDVVGNRIASLTSNLSFQQENRMLVDSAVFFGQRYVAPTGGNDTRIQPVFANGDTFENQKEYVIDDNFSFNWDVAGDNIPLEDYMNSWSYRFQTFNRPDHVQRDDGEKFPKSIRTLGRGHGMTFNIKRTDETSVFDDYVNQPPSNTFKNADMQIFNTSTNYRKYNWSEVAIKSCKLNHALEGQEPTYDIEAVIGKLSSFVTRDGVSQSLYGY